MRKKGNLGKKNHWQNLRGAFRKHFLQSSPGESSRKARGGEREKFAETN